MSSASKRMRFPYSLTRLAASLATGVSSTFLLSDEVLTSPEAYVETSAKVFTGPEERI